MLEAAHAGVPLVVVTADRPARLRGTSANQTTDQVGHLRRRWSADARRAAGDARPRRRSRPAVAGRTCNVQLDEPLVPGTGAPQPAARRPPTPASTTAGRRAGRPDGGRGRRRTPRTRLAAVGPAHRRGRRRRRRPAGAGARRAGGWPLLAEPTSGSRTGANAIRTYRLLLGDRPRPTRIERVVVFGHPTLSPPGDPAAGPRRRRGGRRAGRAAPGPDRPFRGRRASSARSARRRQPDDPAWLEEWRAADARGRRAGSTPCSPAEPGLTPHDVAGAVAPRAAARRAAVRRRLEPDPRPRPDGAALPRSATAGWWSPTAAWPASTAPSRPRSAPRSAGRTAAGRSR